MYTAVGAIWFNLIEMFPTARSRAVIRWRSIDRTGIPNSTGEGKLATRSPFKATGPRPPVAGARNDEPVGLPAGTTANSRHPHRNAPPALTDVALVSAPERHRSRAVRTRRAGWLEVTASSYVLVDGQGTGPYDGHWWQHRLGPPPPQCQLVRRGSLAFRDPLILPATGADPSNSRRQTALPPDTSTSPPRDAANTPGQMEHMLRDPVTGRAVAP